ncbi:MAG: DNA polymerase III subunit delta [Caldisericaceae bacterium]
MTRETEIQAVSVLNDIKNKDKPLMRAYYLFGANNDYLKSQIIASIKERLVNDEFASFDFITLSADSLTSFNEVEFAVNGPPFGEAKLVVLRNAHTLSKHESKRLSELIVPDFCTLIVVSDSDKPALNLLRDTIIVNKYDVSEEMAKAWIKSKFKAEGHEVSQDAIKALIERLNGDFALLDLEIKKVSLYVGDRVKVEVKDILDVVENIPEQGIYELIDAIVSRNKELAVAQYQRMTSSANPVQENILLSELLKSFTEILLIKDMLNKGVKSNDEIAEHLKRIYSINFNKYVVAKIIKNTEKYSLKDIFSRFEILQEIDTKSKIGEIELPLALKLFVET